MLQPTAPPKNEPNSHPEPPLKFAGDPMAELASATHVSDEDGERARTWARIHALQEQLREAGEQLAIERRRCAALERQLERMRG